MPGRANSTVNVNITGDARDLQRAAAKAEGAVGGMNKKILAAGAVIGGVFAADQLVDFGNTAVKEADRVADAAGRIEGQLGADLAKTLRDRADDFSALGASEGDMLELEARLIDIGTAAGIAAPDLATFAEDAAEVASAMALATDVPADEWITKIGKAAASGDARSLRDLGIDLDEAAVNARALADTGKDTVDALTEGELAAARQAEIIAVLTERYGGLEDAGGDLEAKQAAVQAKFETLTGKIGEALEGPLSDLLDFILAGIAGWEMFADQLNDANSKLNAFIQDVKNALAPLARLIDLLSALATFDAFDFTSGGPVGKRVPSPINGGGMGGLGPNTVNVNVQGGSPEVIEQSVRRAVEGIARRSGRLE